MTKSRNTALAAALIVLAGLFYGVTVVRMREAEDRQHLSDPKAHASPAAPATAAP